MAQNYAEKYSSKVDERFTLASLTNAAINSDYDFVGVNAVNITYSKLTNMDWVQQWLERKGYSSINSFDSDTIHLHKRL